MANTYHQIYLQVVFAVKHREAKLHPHWRKEVFSVIGNVINELGCKTIIVNGVRDHVHCFLSLKPSISISEVLQAAKARSSKYINDHKLTKTKFEWQSGFGVFSYSQSSIHNVYKYIERQEIHHNDLLFKDEYLDLLKQYEVDYNNEYLFKDVE